MKISTLNLDLCCLQCVCIHRHHVLAYVVPIRAKGVKSDRQFITIVNAPFKLGAYYFHCYYVHQQILIKLCKCLAYSVAIHRIIFYHFCIKNSNLPLHTCMILSSETEQITQASLGFHEKSEILAVCPPWMNSSSGGPSSASSEVCSSPILDKSHTCSLRR